MDDTPRHWLQCDDLPMHHVRKRFGTAIDLRYQRNLSRLQRAAEALLAARFVFLGSQAF
ncbi:hypothetical protein [Candidatus Kuenenia stuttgartiensis]|uniref:hypothetical protein n=1 Tax=Kuenenia stuttgartiensis TaxID=174633 RepID=UPI00146BBBBA|nr:hypothetical protein [Candidatus Kuenenia stuttgartiensis]